MKKIACTIIVFFLTIFTVFSQSAKGKGIFSVSAGAAFPIGAFGEKNLQDSKTGFATTGPFILLDYYFPSTKKIGLAVALHAQNNALATGKMEEELAQAKFYQGVWFGDPSQPPTIPTKSYPNWKVKKDSWWLATAMAGGYGEFPTKNSKLSLITKGMLGVGYAVTPALDGSSITDTATAMATQESGNAFSFSYSLGLSLRYKLSEKLYLLGGLQFLGTGNFRFEDITATITTTRGRVGTPEYSASQSVHTGDVKQTINSLNAGIGIAFRL